MQEQINTIKHIIELVLGQNVNFDAESSQLLIVDNITTVDELALIKHYLKNPQLITDELKSAIIDQQLNKYKIKTEPLLPPAKSWIAYMQKLEHLLDQVKYRKANNFEYHTIMPTQQQLMQLQHECWELTELWYGAGHGNLSCFYNYFIAMSQAAGITRFTYRDIAKFVSRDNYVAINNKDERRIAYENYEAHYDAYVKQGGCRAQGRSQIDATSISNILYHKRARLVFNYQFAKDLVVNSLNLENYGQLPYQQRALIWTMLCEHFPDKTEADQQSIFYRFMEFVNARPGEYFNYFATDLHEVNKVTPQQLHDIVKIAGLQSGHLILLNREITEYWVPKRHFNLQWQRKFDLTLFNSDGTERVIRKAGVIELVRILPNELPYAPGHGLSLCGDGLIDGIKYIGTSAYQWNSPYDQNVDIDNWPRDIEKMFREFKFIFPDIKIKEPLLGEKIGNMMHNSMAYSTIHTTQHTHIFTLSIERAFIYMLPAVHTYTVPGINASFEIVPVGSLEDAFYLRIYFDELENEALIKFILDLTAAMFKHFGGYHELDVHLQLLMSETGRYAFVFEPHAFLTQVDTDLFMNPHSKRTTPRRPQFVQPDGDRFAFFKGEMAGGIEFCKKFFDDTCEPGAKQFVTDFILNFRQ